MSGNVVDTVTIEVTNVNNLPTVEAGEDQTVDENSPVSLNAADSNDPTVSDDVVECADGSQVLAAPIAHRPAWVLMDVEMTEMDGLQATRAITAQFPDARVVIVSQYTDTATREAARAAGAVAFVAKDTLTELRALLT